MKSKDPYIHSILRAKQSVFSINDLAILWREGNRKNLYERLRYYCKKKMLHKIKQGFYAKDIEYDKFEFATRLYAPSYIGLNTRLGQEGINFQYYSSIFVVSYLSREVKIAEQGYVFKKIKDVVLINPAGLINCGTYYQSSKERTILDVMYLYGDFYFDNLGSVDWDKCFELVKIYEKKQMIKRLESYYKDYKEEYEH